MAYLILLALGALDSAGYSIVAPVVPEIGEATGAGPGVIGALVACFAVGQIAGYPVAGRGVQRRSALSVLAASLAVMVVGDLGFVLGEGLAVYFPARLLQGIGAGGLWMGIVFAVLERYPGEEYRRLAGVTAAYSLGSIAGPAMGGAGGIRAPFLVHLGVVVVLAVALAGLGPAGRPVTLLSDRRALRSPGFWLASAGILLVALALGALDGPLPLHFGEQLGQGEIAALYVGTAVVAGASAVAAGRLPPRAVLLAAAFLLPLGIGLAGLAESIAPWIVAAALAGVGIGIGEAGALGVLLESVGVERIVLAMVVWSQVWALGYIAGPAAGGGVAEALGFAAIGLVPLAAALLLGVAFLRAPAATRALA
ncbi:MAG TPA: MFS transporter [Gaiellaceae bacterium]|nr:MFS transporter [Gaiellaceae bacterium]